MKRARTLRVVLVLAAVSTAASSCRHAATRDDIGERAAHCGSGAMVCVTTGECACAGPHADDDIPLNPAPTPTPPDDDEVIR